MGRDLEFPARPYVPPALGGALGSMAASAVLLDGAWGRRSPDGWSIPLPVDVIALLLTAAAVLMTVGFASRRFGRRRGETAHAVPLGRELNGAGCRPREARWTVGRRGTRFELARWAMWAGVGMLVGCIASAAWVARWAEGASAVRGRSASACRFISRGDPSVNDFGAATTADVYVDGRAAPVARVRLNSDEPIEDARELTIVGRVKPLSDDDWGRSRFMRGEVASIDVVRIMRSERAGCPRALTRAREAALRSIDPARSEARALLAGVVCGRTTELNATTAQDAFARDGLTHLVAVSGSHLALISLLLEAGLRRLRVRPASRMAVLVAIMALYVLFTGVAPSAVRSVVMVGCALGAVVLGRRAHPLSGLALAVLAMVAVNPGVVFDLGFQLSAMSVLFILTLGRYLQWLLLCMGLPEVIAAPLSMTLVAQWATLPLTVPVFGQLSLIAPFANLVVGPLMTAVLVVGLIAVPLASLLPMFGVLLAVPLFLARLSIFVAEVLAGVPMAAVGVHMGAGACIAAYVTALGVFALWRPWGRWQLWGMCIAVLALVLGYTARWVWFAPAAVTVLNVGQGDAILLRDGARSLLVDAGVDEQAATALARNHVLRLDAVLITHWDRDHWGGLPEVLETVEVDRLLVAEGASASLPPELSEVFHGEVIEVKAGDMLHIGGFSCRAVWPVQPVSGEENADSLCLDVRYCEADRELCMLLTGDSECDQAAEYVEEVGDIDVLKVGHHASAVSVDQDMLRVLDPEFAVASAGEGNSYGHPTMECQDELAAYGVRFVCTKDAGDVVISPAREGVHVRCSGDLLAGTG